MSISGRRLCDAPSLISVHYENKDLEPLAVRVASGHLSGLSRPDRPEAGYPSSGRLLWDASHLIRSYYKDNDFGPRAAQGPPDGFPASAGWVGRRLKF